MSEHDLGANGAPRPVVAVIGAGPAGLMAAETLAKAGAHAIVFERMPSPARKFLLAGRGGLNLTHSEPTKALLARYGAARPALEAAINAFPADALRAWCEALGIETFVGSSGRVFPRTMKTSPLLRAWIRRLGAAGVEIRTRRCWTGWAEDGALRFDGPDGVETFRPNATVLALGGASWPRLGSDGSWVAPLQEAGVGVTPLEPANCGFGVDWSEHFRSRFAGAPIKRAALSFDGVSVRGEALVTTDGIEGGLIYAASCRLRDAIAESGAARPTLDLRPDLSVDQLAAKLGAPRGSRSMSTHLARTAGLAPVAVALLREGSKQLPEDAAALAGLIKAVPLTLTRPFGLERAISTAGGVRLDAVDDGLMLRARPGVFVAGEMLDWEAPTGGYLLHASFATGIAAAEGVGEWLRRVG